MAKQKHLNNDERSLIEDSLREGKSLKIIALLLGKSTSTISREIKKHAVCSNKSAQFRIPNRCIYKRSCKKDNLCEDKPNCNRKKCSTCNQCNSVCSDFVEEVCSKLEKPPYVCNGCDDEHNCILRKQYYLHKTAQASYKETLVVSREGVNISENELLQLDKFISPLIKKGQSVHHIISNNPDELNCSEKSIYRYVNANLLAARNIDMPRVCRIKPRKTKPVECKVDKKCRIGRTYEDYKSYLENHPDTSIVEMDTVEGKKGGKVLLTLIFKNTGFMPAFLRDNKTSKSVIDVFNNLYKVLGKEIFEKIFPVILTDNGTEFSNPSALEFADDGTRRTRIFYCNSYSPYQKPSVENNHEFIRKILPKGYSFDNLTQDDVDLMMNHINSYSREKLNDKSPHLTFSFLYGEYIINLLGAKIVPSNDIILRPGLLKK